MKDGGRSVLRVGLGPRVGVRDFAAWATNADLRQGCAYVAPLRVRSPVGFR